MYYFTCMFFTIDKSPSTGTYSIQGILEKTFVAVKIQFCELKQTYTVTVKQSLYNINKPCIILNVCFFYNGLKLPLLKPFVNWLRSRPMCQYFWWTDSMVLSENVFFSITSSRAENKKAIPLFPIKTRGGPDIIQPSRISGIRSVYIIKTMINCDSISIL